MRVDASKKLRPLDVKDLARIAEIHYHAFPRSFVTALGKVAIRRYYQWQLMGPHECIALGVEDQGILAGYCFAGVFNGALTGYLQKNLFQLGFSLALRPWLLAKRQHRRRIVKGVKIVWAFSTVKRPALAGIWPAPRTFGILAVAVDPEYGRRGYGTLLMDASERVASERKFERIQLTVDPGNAPAVSFYEALGWLKHCDQGRWGGSMFKLFPCSASPIEHEASSS